MFSTSFVSFPPHLTKPDVKISLTSFLRSTRFTLNSYLDLLHLLVLLRYLPISTSVSVCVDSLSERSVLLVTHFYRVPSSYVSSELLTVSLSHRSQLLHLILHLTNPLRPVPSGGPSEIRKSKISLILPFGNLSGWSSRDRRLTEDVPVLVLLVYR